MEEKYLMLSEKIKKLLEDAEQIKKDGGGIMCLDTNINSVIAQIKVLSMEFDF